jgi:nitroimidazol reductase NimA-like FMN-containing flavoprotein (pyridoxamine 5'-phosphate oxidase superfamily)
VDVDSSGLEPLSRAACVELLSTGTIGRIGFHTDALPVILPVAYAVDGGGIVIRVRSGSQLDAATRDAVVAFEADRVDDGAESWSVAVTGVTSDITDPADLAGARGLPLDGWGGGSRDRFVRISLDLVSGRRAAGSPR